MIPGTQDHRVPSVKALKQESTFGLNELLSGSGLRIEITSCGAIHAIRHGSSLINQFIPGPAEEGFFRLILRWQTADGASGWAHLAGPTVAHRRTGPTSFEWTSVVAPGIACSALLELHPNLTAWRWCTRLTNNSTESLLVDVLMAQDLGLADEGAVRNNEAFNSQYIDLLPVEDDRLGWVILARQNQSAHGGTHPWLAIGCEGGAAAYCTDAVQFFGDDHRHSGVPLAVRLSLIHI